MLGSVFLGVTGAEALYADMGHFGRVPDPRRLADFRAARIASQLSGAGRFDPVQAGSDRQSVLSARARLGAAAARHPGDRRDGDRQSGGGHRRLLAGAAGYSTRPASASGDHAYLGGSRRPDLYRPRQSSPPDRRADPRHHVQEFFGSRLGLWHRSHRHHGDDHRLGFYRRVAQMALALMGGSSC